MRTSLCTGAVFVVGSATTPTEPSGSTEKSAAGSPSFATTANRPSFEIVTMSGSAPTVTLPRIVAASASASKNTSRPGSVLMGFSSAMTPRPSARTATEFATPSAAMANSSVGFVASE